MAKLLYKLGHLAYEKPKKILLTWLLLLVTLVVIAFSMGIKFTGELSIPGTKSEKAGDVLKEAFSQGDEPSGGTIKLIFKTEDGKKVEDKSVKEAIDKTIAEVKKDSSVKSVADPYMMKTISADKTIAYADITYDVPANDVTESSKENILDSIEISKDAGIQTELGGSVAFSSIEIGGVSEVLGVGAAFLILVITFGLFLAAGLPIITALIGLVSGLMFIFIGTNFTETSSFTLSLAAMIGLAVGIDYALFIISRYRQNISEGYDLKESTARSLATAGSAVLFAGVTVIIALSGLLLVGIPFLGVMGIAAAVVVLMVVLVSLTAVPAVISLVGDRISPNRKNKIFTIFDKKNKSSKANKPNAWGKFVSKHPVIIVFAVLLLTISISTSALKLELGLPDNGMKAEDTTERKGYDILAEGFGDGFNGPLIVVADASNVDKNPYLAIQESVKSLNDIGDIESISPVIQNQTGKVAMVNIQPKSGPNNIKTKELVKNIREKAEDVEKDTAVKLMVTGSTAVNIDISEKLSDAMPKFVVVIIGLALILMILVFRSILVPVKAVLGFAMTLASTLGFGVIVLQEGNFRTLLGIPAAGPIVCFMPILATGILFGLAMDYEVFLVSRMRENFMKKGKAKEAVVSGINHSGTVVTAAGLIMAIVFASFIFNEDIIIKSMGLTLAFGVLFDAFVIRMTFVPAVMMLLGKGAWYIPNWLNKILPKFDIEGESINEDEFSQNKRKKVS